MLRCARNMRVTVPTLLLGLGLRARTILDMFRICVLPARPASWPAPAPRAEPRWAEHASHVSRVGGRSSERRGRGAQGGRKSAAGCAAGGEERGGRAEGAPAAPCSGVHSTAQEQTRGLGHERNEILRFSGIRQTQPRRTLLFLPPNLAGSLISAPRCVACAGWRGRARQ